jgi:hypothetical protein
MESSHMIPGSGEMLLPAVAARSWENIAATCGPVTGQYGQANRARGSRPEPRGVTLESNPGSKRFGGRMQACQLLVLKGVLITLVTWAIS